MLVEEQRYDCRGREAKVLSSLLIRLTGREYSEARLIQGGSDPASTA